MIMHRFLFLALIFAPAVTLAAPRTFSELADLVTNLINGGIGVALILGIVIYFYGVVTSIPKTGAGDLDRLRAHFVWGLIALFVMFSVWGILALLRNTLFGSSGYDFNSGDQQALCDGIDDCTIIE